MGASVLHATAGSTALGRGDLEVQRRRLERACMDFEAVFVKQLVTSSRETTEQGEGLFGNDAASGWVADIQDTCLAEAISRSRTLGLAQLVFQTVWRQVEAQASGNGKGQRVSENRSVKTMLGEGGAA